MAQCGSNHERLSQSDCSCGAGSSYSSDISWAGMRPTIGTVSSKSWNAWLMSHTRLLALGVRMSWAVQLLNNTYRAQDDTSMRGVASRVRPSFRSILEGWKKLSLLLRVWPGRMLRQTLTLLL